MSRKVKAIDGIHYLPDAQALLEVVPTSSASRRTTTGNPSLTGLEMGLISNYHEVQSHERNRLQYIPWGEDNLFPYNLLRLTIKNNIAPGIINTKIDFVSGKKIILYKEHIGENKKIEVEIVEDPEIEDWLEENEVDEQMTKIVTDDIWFGNFAVEFIRAKSGKKIAGFKHHDMMTVRAANPYKRIPVYKYLLNDWINDYVSMATEIMKFKREKPFAYPNSLYHVFRYFPGSFYYGLPDYIGSENWMRLANKIPIFHDKGMDNTYQIRWHIQIPQDYFEQFDGDAKKEEKRLREEMNDFLAGAQNAGKAFVTRYAKDHNGNKKEGWIIEPVKAEYFDEAFVKLYEQSNVAITSSHSIDPSISGVQTQGKLSSGSDKRISYDMFLKLKVPSFRKRILKPLYEVKRANNWNKKIKFGMLDYELTTLDEKHEGGQEVVQEE